MVKKNFSQHLTIAREFRRTVRPTWTLPFRSKEFAQNYVSSLEVGVRAPLRIATFSNIADLPELYDLPRECVVKPIAGNGNRGIFVISDGFCFMSGCLVTRSDIENSFRSDPTISSQKVIVEEFVHCAVRPDGMPRDYKFYNFGKRCAFIHIIERNSRKDQRQNRHFFLNEDLTPFHFQVQKTQTNSDDPLVLPACFPHMLKAARAISESLCSFVRVDLYADMAGPIIGELTPFPHGGKGYLPEADKFLGQQWRGRDGASRLDALRYIGFSEKWFNDYWIRRAKTEYLKTAGLDGFHRERSSESCQE